MKYLIFLLLLSACAPIYVPPTYAVPTEVQPYLSTFESLYGQQVNNIQYSFEHLDDPDILGEAYVGDYKIVFSSDWWPLLSEKLQEQLVLHELGHEVLYRAHQNGIS